MSIPTGIKKLDRVLGGGFRDRDRALLYGPSFQGKEVLAHQIMSATLAAGKPAVMLLTSRGVDEVRRDMQLLDAKFPEYEKQGLVYFVDTYSRSIGIEDDSPGVEFVESPVDLNSISLALNKIHAKVIAEHETHLLLVDSVSTLVLYGNAQATFRFMQVLVGRARQAGATSVLLLDHGMHSDAEVQMFKHLTDGVIMMRADESGRQISVEGLGLPSPPGWIDYEIKGTMIEITGSMAAGRIR